jgi:23S rRNA pseudouridine955/2504/2580 synthase
MGNRSFKLKKIEFSKLILYEDEELVCINKPVGISCLKERVLASRDLITLSRNYNPNLQLCHRIDKFTSGVLLFAKSETSYRAIARQFRKREVEKKYWALVASPVELKNVIVKKPIAIGKKGVSRIDWARGKMAITVFNTLHRFNHYSLIECQPITGRQHQIRVHLAYLRIPIVGDDTYGGENLFLSKLKKNFKPGDKEEVSLNISYLLHAHSIQLTHPLSGEKINLEAPNNKNFNTCLALLEKFDTYSLPSKDWSSWNLKNNNQLKFKF